MWQDALVQCATKQDIHTVYSRSLIVQDEVCCQEMAEEEERMKIHLSRNVVASVVACLFALLLLLSTALPAAATTSSNEPDIASIDAYINAQMQASHIPGLALGLVHNDQIVYL